MSNGGNQQVTAAGVSTSSQLCPNQPNRRLPVPVNLTQSHQGKLASDAIIQSQPSQRNEGNEAKIKISSSPITQMFQPKPCHTQLKVVPKPSCRQTEYDSYDGRLATYSDWPESNPMDPAELARAGFYYTQYRDKVKCPYCFGGVYNWEPTDNAFSEHVRHNPNCEFMKYMAYHCLSTPVPGACQKGTHTATKFKDIPAIKAVQSLGYSLGTIRKALNKAVNYSNIGTDVILDSIFAIEKETGVSLIGSEINGGDATCQLEGAVGGLNLNGEDNIRDINPEYQHLQEETKQLQQNTNCTICQFRPKDCLYLPCGHLVACEQCTKDVENCLQCHQKIVSTTKVLSRVNSTDENQEISYEAPRSSQAMETEDDIYEASPSSKDNRTNEEPAFQQKLEINDPEYERLKAEHKRLKQSTICNKCNRRPVDCLFLPCRHLVSCEQCAETIENCLQCNQEIIGTVKVFLT